MEVNIICWEYGGNSHCLEKLVSENVFYIKNRGDLNSTLFLWQSKKLSVPKCKMNPQSVQFSRISSIKGTASISVTEIKYFLLDHAKLKKRVCYTMKTSKFWMTVNFVAYHFKAKYWQTDYYMSPSPVLFNYHRNSSLGWIKLNTN